VAMVIELSRSALLHLADLAHAAPELLRGAELRFEVCRQNLLGDPDADDPGTHANHVDIVVLHALGRRVHVMAKRRADAIHLVRGDAGPDSGSTHMVPRAAPPHITSAPRAATISGKSTRS